MLYWKYSAILPFPEIVHIQLKSQVMQSWYPPLPVFLREIWLKEEYFADCVLLHGQLSFHCSRYLFADVTINSIGEIMSALLVSVICILWKVIQDSFSKHLQVKYTKYHKRHSLLMYNLRQKNMKWGSEKLKPSLIELGLAVRFLKCKHSLY